MLLVEVALGEVHDDGNDFFLRGVDPKPVEAEEEVHGLKGHPFVAVQEGMVLRDPEAVGGGECEEIGVGFVVEAIARPIQGGLEKGPVPDTERPTVILDLIGMDGEHYH